MLKTITSSEKLALLNHLLPYYLERVLSGDSALVRIFGVFQVQCVGNYCTNLLLMENIDFVDSRSSKFDLKGSSYKRLSIDQSSISVGLDVDFRNFGKLELDPDDAQKLFSRVARDSLMLASKNVMDYSLLVTVCYKELPSHCKSPHVYRSSKKRCVYLIALIDILQEYNFSKKAETFWKTKVKRVPLNALSSVKPRLYSQRLLSFLTEAL
jgi:1-phosphatidylinositol-4-phosphate 5-kinase